jgi:uncharacterized membrane protein HdeD (DUF308 family)
MFGNMAGRRHWLSQPTLARRLAFAGNASANSVSAPASPTLRWLTAALLFAGAGLSLVLPFVSATFLTILLGSAATVAGVSQLLRLTAAADTGAKVFRALSGSLYLLGGITCIVYPIQSTVSLTLFLGVLLLVEGVMELAAAASQAVPARGLVLIDGIVTAVLGGMLVAEWPSDSVWAIGTLFAISLGFSAVNLLTAPKAEGAG